MAFLHNFVLLLLLSSILPDSGELRPAAKSEFMGLVIYSPWTSIMSWPSTFSSTDSRFKTNGNKGVWKLLLDKGECGDKVKLGGLSKNGRLPY